MQGEFHLEAAAPGPTAGPTADPTADAAGGAATTEPEGGPGTQRPGGRTARNREAVLEATVACLSELGYVGTCVTDIATRAGVSPSTIYRRWGNRDGVILDVALTLVAEPLAVLPDTGSLETDLAALAQAIVDIMESPGLGTVQAALFAAAVHTPTARQTLTRIIAQRVEDTKVLAERAVERGEIPAGTDPRQVIDTLAAPIYHRWCITGETPCPEELARFAKVAAHAAAHGLLA